MNPGTAFWVGLTIGVMFSTIFYVGAYVIAIFLRRNGGEK